MVRTAVEGGYSQKLDKFLFRRGQSGFYLLRKGIVRHGAFACRLRILTMLGRKKRSSLRILASLLQAGGSEVFLSGQAPRASSLDREGISSKYFPHLGQYNLI